MTVEQILTEQISTRIASLTGKVFFLKASESVKEPYAVVSTISGIPSLSSLGDMGGTSRLQVSIFDSDRHSLAQLTEDIKNEFFLIRGNFSGLKVDQLRVTGSLLRVVDVDSYQAIIEFSIAYRS
jgi:hypothetical protein